MSHIKFIRIFLLVLIIVGVGLLVTQKIWVPKVVEMILENENQGQQISTLSNSQNLQSNPVKNPVQLFSNQKVGCSLLPYTGTTSLNQLEYYSPGDEDLRGGMICNFVINPTLPVFTFNFIGQPDNTLGNIEITEGNSPKVIQTISNSTDENAINPGQSQNILIPADVNFDGYLDAPILNQCGATGNCSYDFYLYNPTTAQFVKNDFLTSNLGTFQLDNVNKQITTSWNSSAADGEADTYQYQNGRYVLIQKVVQISSQNQTVVTKKVYKLQNGTMTLVSSSTTPNN